MVHIVVVVVVVGVFLGFFYIKFLIFNYQQEGEFCMKGVTGDIPLLGFVEQPVCDDGLECQPSSTQSSIGKCMKPSKSKRQSSSS